jgi:hypothetical protein
VCSGFILLVFYSSDFWLRSLVVKCQHEVASFRGIVIRKHEGNQT